jgi:hypothetical protein
MAKFRFFQDKEVKTWVRDYFNVEAETLDEAIEYVKNMGCPFEDDECKHDTKVEFEYRDTDWMFDQIIDLASIFAPVRYSICSKDLDDTEQDSEIVHHC